MQSCFLILNAGSSSLKFAVFQAEAELARVASGAIERIGHSDATVKLSAPSPGLGPHAAEVQQVLRDKLLAHKRYITEHGEDLPEIRDWKWNASPESA